MLMWMPGLINIGQSSGSMGRDWASLNWTISSYAPNVDNVVNYLNTMYTHFCILEMLGILCIFGDGDHQDLGIPSVF